MDESIHENDKLDRGSIVSETENHSTALKPTTQCRKPTQHMKAQRLTEPMGGQRAALWKPHANNAWGDGRKLQEKVDNVPQYAMVDNSSNMVQRVPRFVRMGRLPSECICSSTEVQLRARFGRRLVY